MNELFERQWQLILREIDILHASIRNYDSILFTIKGWAITIFAGFVYFAGKERKSGYLVFCGVAIVLFWTLDAIYKGFQRTFIIRYNKIEHVLRRDLSEIIRKQSFGPFKLPDVGARFSVAHAAQKTNAFRAAFYWHTAILYVAMLTLVLFLALWLHYQAG